jgi:hypothetical protein
MSARTQRLSTCTDPSAACDRAMCACDRSVRACTLSLRARTQSVRPRPRFAPLRTRRFIPSDLRVFQESTSGFRKNAFLKTNT